MDKKAVLEIIDRFKVALERRSVKVHQIILYGSFARGDFHAGSDIDLVVISDDFRGRGFWERIDILSRAVYEVLEPIEAVAMTRSEWEKKESRIAEYAAGGEVVFPA